MVKSMARDEEHLLFAKKPGSDNAVFGRDHYRFCSGKRQSRHDSRPPNNRSSKLHRLLGSTWRGRYRVSYAR